MPDLPPLFLERLSELLGDEFPAFLASYARPPRAGLRLNMLRLAPVEKGAGAGGGPTETRLATAQLSMLEALSSRCPGLRAAARVAWCPGGYALPEPAHVPGEADFDELARHPYHAAGVYYLQEPSAMAPAEVLAPQPGEAVLDLCAAPGGKATQLAALMQNQGLLVANDTHARRARALAMNLERCGVTCALVLNETPERLAARWPGGFDRVLVDAPCSGQGMFRKDRRARSTWQAGRVKTDAARQGTILDAAAQLARPGGLIVYSTCTFEPLENEANVARFLQRHPDFELEDIELVEGFAPGRPEWADGNLALAKTVRVWPHLAVGEGHFIARLRCEGEGPPGGLADPSHPQAGVQAGQLWRAFCNEHLACAWPGQVVQAGRELYLAPPAAPGLKGLRVVRWGWWVGTLKGKVFVPGHALAMALTPAGARQVVDFAPDDPQLAVYLRGESLHLPGEPAWVLVTVDGFPLGWGKRVDDVLKNRRPPGLAQVDWE